MLEHTIQRVKEGIDRLIVLGNQEPVLTIRRVIWFFTGGLWLAILYCVAALVMLGTIVFAPFSLQVLRIALFALDGGITMEPFTPQLSASVRTNPWNNPAHPYTIAANVAWAVLIGWQLVLFHLTAALVQALTVVGISTALTNVELATYVIWPFGRGIRRKQLPTTLADLYLSRMPPSPTQAWV